MYVNFMKKPQIWMMMLENQIKYERLTFSTFIFKISFDNEVNWKNLNFHIYLIV